MSRRLMCPVTFTTTINVPVEISEGEDALYASQIAVAVIHRMATSRLRLATAVDALSISCQPDQCKEITP